MYLSILRMLDHINRNDFAVRHDNVPRVIGEAVVKSLELATHAILSKATVWNKRDQILDLALTDERRLRYKPSRFSLNLFTTSILVASPQS